MSGQRGTAPPGTDLVSTDLVVTGVGVCLPWTDRAADAAAEPAPGAPDGWFDPKVRLGRRGYKYLPPACQYLLAAGRAALADAAGPGDAEAGGVLASVDPSARGVAVGTNCAASRLHAEMNRTIIETDADEISPALAPFFSINLFGSRLGAEHACQAFNLTLTSPRLAGLDAFALGARAVRLGRAEVLLVGVTEDAVAPGEGGMAGAEVGAVVLVCEPESRARARGAAPRGRVVTRTRAAAGPAAGWPEVGWPAPDSGGPPAWVTRVPPGSGALAPMRHLAAALAGTVPVLVTAAGPGALGAALVTPSPGTAAPSTVTGGIAAERGEALAGGTR